MKQSLKDKNTENSGKVLLITGCTGLGFNYAPHFGVYQIYNYAKHKGISCDMYDRDLELFKKAKIYEKDVINSLKRTEFLVSKK